MTFIVKYRARNGSVSEEIIEAANRSDCFAKCKARGIVPMSVRETSHPSCQKKSQNSGKTILGSKKIIWSLFLAAIAIASTFHFLYKDAKLPAETKAKTTTTKTIKTSVKNPEVPKPVTNAPAMSKRERQLKQIRDKYGDNIPENLKPVVYFLENPPTQIFHPARKESDIFKRSSEREIAEVINTEPGTWFMRRPTFGQRFDADFRASLNEKIEITDDDSPEQKELKQAVIDAKAEIVSRMKAGDKPSDVMNEYTGSLYELGEYRRTIEEELTRLKKDESFSDKDIEDFVNSANQMLKRKGSKPIRMPQMVFRHISLKRAAEKRAKEERQETGK